MNVEVKKLKPIEASRRNFAMLISFVKEVSWICGVVLEARKEANPLSNCNFNGFGF